MFCFDGTLDIFEYRTTDKYCTEAERNLTLATYPNSTTQRMLGRCKQSVSSLFTSAFILIVHTQRENKMVSSNIIGEMAIQLIVAQLGRRVRVVAELATAVAALVLTMVLVTTGSTRLTFVYAATATLLEAFTLLGLGKQRISLSITAPAGHAAMGYVTQPRAPLRRTLQQQRSRLHPLSHQLHINRVLFLP